VGAAAAAPETKDLMARLPDGRRLHLVCAGEGAPTVLLEGGFAATARAWWKVQPLVARSTRVCAYDRAGAGQSDPGPFPRDARAIADDLGQALRQARIAGPYVVVGHSAGGLYVRAFADLHPREVVGMVLLDPSVEHQDRRFAEVFGPGAGSLKVQRDRALRCEAAARAGGLPSSDPALAICTPRPPATPSPAADALWAAALRPETWATQVSELDSLWGSASDEVAAGRQSYGAMPLVVLTADGTYAKLPPSVRPSVDELWRRLHAEIAARSSRGRTQVVVNSSHMIMIDRPDAVAEAIAEVLEEARGGRSHERP
jgi:pimeloyl-ACP methyl ester carboxylesterase